MTLSDLLDAIAEMGDDRGEGEEILLLEPRDFYDQFIIGLAEKGPDVFVLYDKAAMIEAMATDMASDGVEDGDDQPESMALEHYDFNMNQPGTGLPAYALLRLD